jgi:DNA-directed RNA polymerase specialized sigma24 family protein
MNPRHRAVRAMLMGMAPNRAIMYIQSFHLLPDEETCIMEVDVLGCSRQQVAMRHSMSVETVDERRRRGYRKIIDGIDNP